MEIKYRLIRISFLFDILKVVNDDDDDDGDSF